MRALRRYPQGLPERTHRTTDPQVVEQRVPRRELAYLLVAQVVDHNPLLRLASSGPDDETGIDASGIHCDDDTRLPLRGRYAAITPWSSRDAASRNRQLLLRFRTCASHVSLPPEVETLARRRRRRNGAITHEPISYFPAEQQSELEMLHPRRRSWR